MTNESAIRKPAVAGSWYPADGVELREMMERMFSTAPGQNLPGQVIAVIAPHAGYAYSGPVAARAIKALAARPWRRLILLGPTHRVALNGAVVSPAAAFATPLGNVPVDVEACRHLAGAKGFTSDAAPHAAEHCLEMLLPPLQTALGEFTIVPVLLGSVSGEDLEAIAVALGGLMDEHTALVVSTDFTHFGPNFHYTPFTENVQRNLSMLDGAAIDRILACDRRGFVDLVNSSKVTICGANAVAVALEAASDRPDVEGAMLGYATSGALTGQWDNSVSYAAIALCQGGAAPLTADEQGLLLRLARDQVRQTLSGGGEIADPVSRYGLPPRLIAPGAAFVTLKRQGALRGCIGHVVAVEPLHLSVLHNAVHSCKDPRFTADPITAAEELQLHVEISVLSRYRMVGSTGEIQVGRDGLILRAGRNSGLLLPQVPAEQGWNLEQYLAGLSRKAGLPADGWRKAQARLYRFTAQVFGE